MSEYLDDVDNELDDTDTLSLWDDEGATDIDATEFFQPSNKFEIFGHQQTILHLEYLAASGKMPHALLFTGARGIGKSLVAKAFARMLLTGTKTLTAESHHPIVQQIQAGSLAEYLYISGENRGDDSNDKSSLIDIEQVRAIGQMLSMTRASTPYRVVIIDGAEDMNANAANALLKNLEEPPPQTVMILVSHNVGRLLPTIRSRCRVVPFQPLSPEQCQQVLKANIAGGDEDEAAVAVQLAESSPGLATTYLNQQGVAVYHDLMELLLFSGKDTAELQAVSEFTGKYLSDRAIIHKSFRMVSSLILMFLSRASILQSGFISNSEQQAMERIRGTLSPEVICQTWFDLSEQFSMAERLHLDYKNILIPMLVRLIRGKEPLKLRA